MDSIYDFIVDGLRPFGIERVVINGTAVYLWPVTAAHWTCLGLFILWSLSTFLGDWWRKFRKSQTERVKTKATEIIGRIRDKQ